MLKSLSERKRKIILYLITFFLFIFLFLLVSYLNIKRSKNLTIREFIQKIKDDFSKKTDFRAEIEKATNTLKAEFEQLNKIKAKKKGLREQK